MNLATILLVALGAGTLANAALAADQVQYAPPESWVKAAAIPPADSVSDSGAVQILLVDDQSRFADEGDVFYSERAFRLRTSQALAGGNLLWSWNPETETLTVHKLNIIRDGKIIHVLAGDKKLTILRRETNLEAAALDGALTATIQAEDLRVGDILDYAISLRRKDPLRRGYSEGFGSIDHAGVAGRVRLRAVWAASRPMRWRATEGMEAPTLVTNDGETEALIDREKVEAPKKPAGAPRRFRQVGQLEFSQFRDWAEVSGIMAPLYRKAAALAPSSPLKVEAAKIKEAFPGAKGRAMAALKLVEEQTRYVFLGMNLGGYLPADADQTWSRRFGDCKGKTALLLALLRELGVEAEPAFVSTVDGDGLDRRLPMLGVFDHVLVRAQIDGKTYWLDGTRMGDRDLDDIPPPGFHWALPLRDTGAQLISIVQPSFLEPKVQKIVKLEVASGLVAPAVVHAESLFSGDAGIAVHLVVDEVSKAELDRYLRRYWSAQYPWIKADAVGSAYDAQTGVMRVWIDGKGALNWTQNGSYRDFQVIDSGFGGAPDYHREEGPNRDAPFAVEFPFYERRTVTVALPQKGTGFNLWNPGDLNTTIGGVAYRRTASLKDGVVTVVTENQSLRPEFPAAEAEAALEALRKLGFSNVFVRALAPSSAATASAAPREPKDAAGFAAAGATAVGAGDYAKAIQDFTQAIALNPASANYVYDRGVAYFQKGEDDLALSDFNAALKLNPADSLILTARAELQLFHGRGDQARRDFDEAFKTASDKKVFLLRRADAYADNGLPAQSVAFYEDWLKAYSGDAGADEVRGRLCLAKAEADRDPSAIIKECEAVLARKPLMASAKEGRALGLLRQSRLGDAITAFDSVLNANPNSASALYGRGLARIRAGSADLGQRDLKAAALRDPGVADRFRAYGLAP